MKKRAVIIEIIYLVISLIDIIGAWVLQAESYIHGGGYLMDDISSYLFFIIFTILYTIAWYREIARKVEKSRWRLFILSISIVLLVTIILYSLPCTTNGR